MNEYTNPSCNSLLATSCFEFTMARSPDQGRVTAHFIEGVSSSAEG